MTQNPDLTPEQDDAEGHRATYGRSAGGQDGPAAAGSERRRIAMLSGDEDDTQGHLRSVRLMDDDDDAAPSLRSGALGGEDGPGL